MSCHRKVYQNFIFNFGDIWKGKLVLFVPDLKRFLLYWKTCFIPSVGMFILYVIRTKLYKVLGESIDRIGLLAKKVVSYIKVFLSVNIFIIKQSMLLTFLPLLRIAGSGD